MLAREEAAAVPAAFARPGEVGAVLSCEASCTWPDRRARKLAAAVLEQGGIVAMEFRTLGDAILAHRRALAEVTAA